MVVQDCSVIQTAIDTSAEQSLDVPQRPGAHLLTAALALLTECQACKLPLLCLDLKHFVLDALLNHEPNHGAVTPLA